MKNRKRSFNHFISAVRLLLLSSKNAKEYEKKPKTEGKQDDDKTVHDPDTSVERTILSKLIEWLLTQLRFTSLTLTS
jgi:hypothetical protein